MALNNTGNAVGSDSPLDLQDNATVLDDLINGTDMTVTGRLGNILKSYAALVKQMESSGGALAYKDAATLLASTPATSNVLAMDTATGAWYFWNGTAWAKSAYQPDTKIQSVRDLVSLISAEIDSVIMAVSRVSTDVLSLSTTYTTDMQYINSACDILANAISLTNITLDNYRTSQPDGTVIQTALESVLSELSKLDSVDLDALGAVSPAVMGSVYAFPEPESLITLNVVSTSGLPSSKDADSITANLSVRIDGQTFECVGDTSVQGAGSATLPKKNYSFDLYSDSSLGSDVSLKIGNIIPHDTWIFKCNYTDPTQIRNKMANDVWDLIQENRTGFPRKDIDNSYSGLTGIDAVDTGATGHPIGYPCVMYFNGEFYGTGVFMVGKKRINYNMPKNKPTKVHIAWEWDESNQFNIMTLPDGSYEIREPSKPNSDTDACFTAWKSFASLSQSDFTSQCDTYLDSRNIVDFYLLQDFIGNYDFMANNTQMLTWDGVKWFFLPYDMDLTFFNPYKPVASDTDMFLTSLSAPFWAKIKVTYGDSLKARYAELRTKGVFTSETVYDLSKGIMNKFTPDIYSADLVKWGLTMDSIENIVDWQKKRIAYMDSKFNFN